VRDTFAVVQAVGKEAASYFYGWLFASHPELRELFPPAMDVQRDRLFRALGRIVESLSTPEEMAAYLAQLGRDHRKFSVQPEMYGAVGDALVATLRAYAGSAFTPAAQEAWAQAFGAVSLLMIKAAETTTRSRLRSGPPRSSSTNSAGRVSLSSPWRRISCCRMNQASTSACRLRAGRGSGGRTRSPAGRARTV
jgi:hemoglobin-like flavoprotein